MVEDIKGQRNLEDFGGGLLSAVEGHSLEWNSITLHDTKLLPDL